MWRPAQRIKYKPAPGDWPSAQQAAESKLFSPVRIGATELLQRTWVPAMVPWRATEEGFITDELLGWYERFAKGRPGAIVVEATGIRDIPSGPLLRIGHQRFLPGLRELVQTIERASGGETRLLIQLIDFLRINRRPTREKYFGKYLQVTAAHREALRARGAPEPLDEQHIRAGLLSLPDEELQQVLTRREYEAYAFGYRERVSDLHLAHIRELPQSLPGLFAQAAVRAREAGFDGVELHYAHAYTMASFLSGHNTRGDGYGGDREGRVRLPLEVFAAVREAVGEDYTVGCRYLTQDCVEGGMTVEDAAWFGICFARAGMDFLSLSRGGKFEDAKQPKVGAAAYPYTGRSGYECMPQYISDEQGPFGRNLPATGTIRRAIREAGCATPVVAAGGIHGFAEAERVLRDGEADIIGAARQSLADPDWYLKMRLGLGREVRVCLYTNYCEALDTRHKQVTCELWDREGLDSPAVMLSSDGKRRLLAPAWQPQGSKSGTGDVSSSVYQAFLSVAARAGGRAFLRAPAESTRAYAPGAVSYTYEQAQRAVNMLRAAYAGQRLAPGERVAVAYDARLDVYLHLLALNSLGSSIVPLNMNSSDRELQYLLEHSDSIVLTGATEHIDRLTGIAESLHQCRVLTPDALLAGAIDIPEQVSVTPATEVALIYTSGTTGKPKGCMLSNEYFLSLGRWYNELGGVCRLDGSDRLLTPLPPSHMNALCTSFMGMLLAGGCVIQLDRFHPSSWWQSVREERATIIHYLGIMPAILLSMPRHQEDDFSGQLRFGLGAGIDPRHHEVFEQRFGFPLIEAWSMSETGAGAVTVANLEPRYPGQRCIGKPPPELDFRMVDEHDKDVARGEPGELLVRQRGDKPRQDFFSGYYKDEQATEHGWRGGWWHTGDVVREGEDGSLFFVDRRKNVIRRSGENIAAVEVETVLARHPLVSQCAVTAVPDELRGDEVFALIVTSDEVTADMGVARSIFEFCMERLAYFKAPGYVYFCDALPLTGSQKIMRGEVRKIAAAAVRSSESLDLRELKKRSTRTSGS